MTYVLSPATLAVLEQWIDEADPKRDTFALLECLL